MRILFAGDFHTHQSDGVSFGNALTELINLCDYSAINFESPVASAVNSKHPTKSGPRLSQPRENLLWLKNKGFNCLMLANNHIYDYGTDALRITIDTAKDLFHIAGAGNWEESYQPLILEKDNKTIAILNLAELQCGVLCDTLSDSGQLGCAWINHPSVFNIITEAKTKCDYVIAVTHAGLENVEIPLPEWRDRYRQLIDYGCDAVIGAHPHICQGYEIYHDKPIVYSLGNFYFDSLSPHTKPSWFRGEVAVLDFNNGHTELSLHGITSNNNIVELLKDEEWNLEIKRLNGLLEGDNYFHIVNDICNKKLNHYYNQFSSGGCIHIDKNIIKSIARKLFGRCNEANLLNSIQCESHRWCITRALRNQIYK